MAFSTTMNERDRILYGVAVRRRAKDFRHRLKYAFPVGLALIWVVVLLATAIVGWLSGRPVLVASLLGLGLLVAISLIAVAITLSAAVTRMTGGRRPVRAPRPPGGDDYGAGIQFPRVTELADCWSAGRGAQTLTAFLNNFDGSLSALRLRLIERLGEEMGTAMPLHQQIDTARELGIWSADDVTEWRTCLRARTEILTDGAEVPIPRLARWSDWLEALSARTFSSVT